MINWFKTQWERIDTALYHLAYAKANLVSEPWVHFVHRGISFGISLIASIVIPRWEVLVISFPTYAFIEFVYDWHWERQPFSSNLHDFDDYTIGLLAFWILRDPMFNFIGHVFHLIRWLV